MRRSASISLLVLSCFACDSGGTNTSGDTLPSSMTSGTTAPTAGSGGAAVPAAGAPGGGTTGSAGAAGIPASGSGGGSAGASGQAGAAGSSDGAAGSADAGSSAGAGGVIAGAGGSSGAGGMGGAPAIVVPEFVKTRCIDPAKIKPDVEVNFPCDGVDLWVVVPKQCQMRQCGLIFNIHGGGMTDHATMDQATNMIALGSAADFVVMHPHKGTWSVSSDRNAVFGFMQQAIEAFDIDPKRVHSTGYSQGGQLSWALACEHADVVASVAPAEEINRVTDCWKPSKLPVREIPILFAYGKQDSIGGGYAAAAKLAGDAAAAWKMTGPETIAGQEGSKYWRQRWTSTTGNVLEFISQDYSSTGVGGILAGHCLPMASGKTFVSCSTPVDYDWGQEVVRFFQAHPMP